ncbi:MAG: phospholipid/cholesterol/gamma-HCH transport system substrate-binding protein [Rhodothermales bacterium]
MKYSNELKVGTTLVLAIIIFILGLRYFEDLPLFRGTHLLETELSNASGLIPGNTVRVNGVTVGSVDQVYINPETNGVRVHFHVDKSLPITEGSRAFVSGLDALGVVRMDVELGPAGGQKIADGGFVASKESADIFGDLAGRAPALLEQVDGAMRNLTSLLGESETLLANPESDFRQTLLSARRSANTLDNILRTQRDKIESVLSNVDGITEGFNEFLEGNADSLGMAISAMNATMTQLETTLDNLAGTTAGIDTLLRKINEGQGTLGLLINDPSMYHRTDSLLTTIEALLADFQENPGRYLKEMRLVDLF